jgi:hypothetical protein
LKKRTKKLLRRGRGYFGSRALLEKSFLLLFFKKEVLSCLTQGGCHG